MKDLLKGFVPNLLPNNPKDGSFDLNATILKNGGYGKYIVLPKKDGCRMEIMNNEIKTRSLKSPSSKLVVGRFADFSKLCEELNIAVEGEFYMHGSKFNAIFRFFSKSDVTCPKYKGELIKLKAKDTEKFNSEYDGLDINFLTTFHNDLKFWLFDGIVLDRPDLVGFEERMDEILARLNSLDPILLEHIELPRFDSAFDYNDLQCSFDAALELGFEGLVLIHKDHKYKYGRNSLKEGTLLKMKDDSLEYDGVVIDVEEATSVKEGVEKTVNELGRSVTSKKKGDRENSGIAKGFIVAYSNEEGQCVGTFTVCLKGFDNEQRKEMFANRGKYIGRHFKYTAMKPVLNFPRHAYFDTWRDSK